MTYATYKKKKRINKRLFTRGIGALLVIGGLSVSLYIFSPLLLWELYIAPRTVSDNLIRPIPQQYIFNSAHLSDLFTSTVYADNLDNASNWYPGLQQQTGANPPYFSLDIPKLNIKDAQVSTVDEDLTKHLVNFAGTCTPPAVGNCVIFGHSTLPQLYNPGDYKTIFAHILSLSIGDTILVHINGITYTYKVTTFTVVDPDDVSVLNQSTDQSVLTIITCVPPGTTWKRLVITSVLQPL